MSFLIVWEEFFFCNLKDLFFKDIVLLMKIMSLSIKKRYKKIVGYKYKYLSSVYLFLELLFFGGEFLIFILLGELITFFLVEYFMDMDILLVFLFIVFLLFILYF